jgi:hypothetical protein
MESEVRDTFQLIRLHLWVHRDGDVALVEAGDTLVGVKWRLCPVLVATGLAAAHHWRVVTTGRFVFDVAWLDEAGALHGLSRGIKRVLAERTAGTVAALDRVRLWPIPGPAAARAIRAFVEETYPGSFVQGLWEVSLKPPKPRVGERIVVWTFDGWDVEHDQGLPES